MTGTVESITPNLATADASVPQVFDIDTGSASLLHRMLLHPGSSTNPVVVYLLALAVLWIPLLMGAVATPVQLLSISNEHQIRLHNDWNALFMFLISFPCVVLFCLTDQNALSNALRTVQLDGTVTFSDHASSALALRWRRRFRFVNITGQFVGVLVGLTVASVNYYIYLNESVGFWISDNGQLLPIGMAFLYCVAIFYTVISIYVVRNVAIAFFFGDIVKLTDLRLLPMHPDRSGGLHPVGQLGLRNQYVLMLLGVNLVLLATTTGLYLQYSRSLYELVAVAALTYVLLGPLVFAAPLLPFRAAMIRTKTELLAEVAQRLRVELQRIRSQIPSGPILKDDEELIERLRKIGTVIGELPVWPFDASTLRRFLAAYILPALTTVGYPVAKELFEFAKNHLK